MFFRKASTLKFSRISRGSRRGTKANQIIHVCNLLNPSTVKSEGLRFRIQSSLDSISAARKTKVTLVGCSPEDPLVEGWRHHSLTRTAASVFKESKDFAFIKDMLDAGALLAGPDDFIFYSNLDCSIPPQFYEDIYKSNADITEFLRKDVDFSADSGFDIFNARSSVYEIGVDGLCIRKSVYMEIRDQLPDCVIGEPHWDTVYSGILHKNYEVHQSTELYHIKHAQQWDDSHLTEAGEHNRRLYRECVNYGLMEDNLISLKKGSALILLDSSRKASEVEHLAGLINTLSFYKDKMDIIFCELKNIDDSPPVYVSNIKYFPIVSTNKYTSCLDQTNTIINCLLHQFSSFTNVIVIKSSLDAISLTLIKEIQLALHHHGLFINEDIFAIKSKKILDNELDIYEKNANMEDVSYINDDGLLELLNNHDPEHI
tara:strand:+ start:1508 stop:2794 length:1287 start_codon:yes stop_codon:yes gene_type:complete